MSKDAAAAKTKKDPAMATKTVPQQHTNQQTAVAIKNNANNKNSKQKTKNTAQQQ